MDFSLIPRWALGFSGGSTQLGGRKCGRFVVVSSTRNMARGPILKGRKLGREAILTIQSLKRAKSVKQQLELVLSTQVCRLLKVDILQVLSELQRQNECGLAYEVFKLVRKEIWYKPDSKLYADMMDLLGGNCQIDEVEKLFAEVQKEMLPDSRVYYELMHAYLRCHRPLDAVDTFEEMKQIGLAVGLKTYMTLVRGLEKKGLDERAAAVRAELDTVFPQQI